MTDRWEDAERIAVELAESPICWQIDKVGTVSGPPHSGHRYHGECAICRADDHPAALAAVVAAAVLLSKRDAMAALLARCYSAGVLILGLDDRTWLSVVDQIGPLTDDEVALLGHTWSDDEEGDG